MPTQIPPKKNAAHTFYVSLASQSSSHVMQTNPTLATGDVKVAIDDGAPANLATLPVVDADFTKRVKVELSSSEMNGDNISIVFSDAAGAEWDDVFINLQTSARQFDDLAYPTTSGRSFDVTTTGAVGIDWANVENPSTALNLSGTNIDVDQVVASVSGSVGSVTTVSDKTGYSLSAGGIQAIWDALTSALTTSGSIGKWIVDKLDVVVSTRLATSGYTAPPSVGAIADQVWDEILSGHAVSGSTGEALSAAGAAGDPWATALPGAYGAGTAGAIVGTNLDATVTSRLATSGYTAPLSAAGTRTAVGLAIANLDTQIGTLATAAALDTVDNFLDTEVTAILTAVDTEVGAIKAKTDNLPSDPADESLLEAAIIAAAAPSAAVVAAQVRTELATELARIDAATSTRATPAQVNTEVLDVMNVDTYAEPGQGTPAATTTLAAKIGWLYKAWRNKKLQTSSQLSLLNDDAVTVDQKATVSDDMTTTTIGEMVSGP